MNLGWFDVIMIVLAAFMIGMMIGSKIEQYLTDSYKRLVDADREFIEELLKTIAAYKNHADLLALQLRRARRKDEGDWWKREEGDNGDG